MATTKKKLSGVPLKLQPSSTTTNGLAPINDTTALASVDYSVPTVDYSTVGGNFNTSSYSPSGLSMGDLTSKYFADKLGLDFNRNETGFLGTTPTSTKPPKKDPPDDTSTMSNYIKGAEALAGLANAYMGYKNYGLSKDKFAFEKAAANRAIANQASEYNTGLQNAGEVGMGLAGNTMGANARLARQAQLDSQKISSAPIG